MISKIINKCQEYLKYKKSQHNLEKKLKGLNREEKKYYFSKLINKYNLLSPSLKKSIKKKVFDRNNGYIETRNLPEIELEILLKEDEKEKYKETCKRFMTNKGIVESTFYSSPNYCSGLLVTSEWYDSSINTLKIFEEKYGIEEKIKFEIEIIESLHKTRSNIKYVYIPDYARDAGTNYNYGKTQRRQILANQITNLKINIISKLFELGNLNDSNENYENMDFVVENYLKLNPELSAPHYINRPDGCSVRKDNFYTAGKRLEEYMKKQETEKYLHHYIQNQINNSDKLNCRNLSDKIYEVLNYCEENNLKKIKQDLIQKTANFLRESEELSEYINTKVKNKEYDHLYHTLKKRIENKRNTSNELIKIINQLENNEKEYKIKFSNLFCDTLIAEKEFYSNSQDKLITKIRKASQKISKYTLKKKLIKTYRAFDMHEEVIKIKKL